jgi:hypothetical protein
MDMRARRTAPASVAAATVLLTASVAVAAPATSFEMPFPCGETWTGTTYAKHSPNPNSIDWNRANDVDDAVVAAAPGTVSVAQAVDRGGYGKYVVIEHPNGEKSLYAHLNRLLVTLGQRVDQGQQIGNVGNTGSSTGPHLHFEERVGGATVAAYFHGVKYTAGKAQASTNCVDTPLAPDWNGDKVAQPTVFRRGNPASFQIHRPGTSPQVVSFGGPTDEPVVGDWDGNGTINPGVRTPATRKFTLRSPGTGTIGIVFGAPADRPVAGNWDGSRAFEVGVWSPASARFQLRLSTGAIRTVVLGDANDLPVTGDWDADGLTDLGVYDQATSTFTLRRVDDEGIVWTAQVAYGTPGDLPVTGDWDGNGRTDLGTWTPATATFNRRIAAAPTAAARTTTTLRFGRHR